MALGAKTVMEINNTATANNVNGGGFNPANANMLTDLTTDSNTANTNSPVCSSASYNFVAGDVGHWLYIKSGTNWTPGWYSIASVASNKATLSAAVGEAVQTTLTSGYPSPRYLANTAAGCATVGTPTGGVFTIDYSQGTAAIVHSTDGVSSASTTFTTATGGITKVMVGNLLHMISATGADEVVGWYEVVSVTDANTMVLDRTSGTYTAADFYIGGALSFNSTLDDEAFEISVATNGTGAFHWFTKTGFTLGEAINIGAAGATRQPIAIEGYQTLRGDVPTGSNRPTIDRGANAFTITGASWDAINLIHTGTSAVSFSITSITRNSKFINTSTTANLNALTTSSTNNTLIDSEFISYRGRSFVPQASGTVVIGCYFHDSDTGIISATGAQSMQMVNSIIADNVSFALNSTVSLNAQYNIMNCTIFGVSTPRGTGWNILTASYLARIFNSIIYGFVTGITHADTLQAACYGDYNNFYNNTTDVNANWYKGVNDIALDPGFTDVTLLTGSSATSSTNVLTVGSGTPFGDVEDNVDFLYISAGTGTGIGLVKYLITSHTTTTLTVSSNITSSGSGSAITWWVQTGHDYTVGTNMKAVAFPGTFPGLS